MLSDVPNERELRLRHLIETLQHHPRQTLAWKRAMHALLQEVTRLPRLARSSHPDYGELLNDTFLQIANRIGEFKFHPQRSIVTSLTHWINRQLRLSYRIKDLYGCQSEGTDKSSANAKAEFRAQLRKPPLSLDAPIGTEGTLSFGDQLPDPRPDLADLEALIRQDQQHQANERISQQIRHYIETDPEKRLRQCHPQKHPDCHCQILAQRLLLKQPPDRFQAVVNDFNVNYHTLRSHWQKQGLPLLQSIAKKMGYDPDREVEN
ncbi:MAG: hypothetical protein HC881_13085 [Leptolyngbyaceae cyanobacterium SL_7_1]|nr:hypothetical protein [Leptolyngbyaceae cyanobacterium SL_7_1]